MIKTIKNVAETEFRAKDSFSRSLSRMNRVMGAMNRIAARSKAMLMATGRAAMFLGRAASRVAIAGFVAISGAAVGGYMAITKLASGMDELAKLTRAIDFPIEQFQEWRFAAEQSGISQDEFAGATKKFTKSVGELKGGYGAMYTAQKKTNPQLLRQLKNTDNVSDAFGLYIEAMRETPGAMNKAAMATAGFGRSGLGMVNIANASAESIAELRAQMRQNGVVTQEQAAKAEAFNDSVNRLKLTAKGLAVDGLSPLMPLLEKGADQLRGWIIENRTLINQKIHEVFTKIVDFGKKAFTFLRYNIPQLIKQLKEIGTQGFAWIKEHKPELISFFGLIKDIGGMLLKVAEFAIKHKYAVLGLVVAHKALGLSMAVINWSQMVAGAASAGTAVGGVTTKVGKLAGALGKGGLWVTAFAAGWAAGSVIFDQWDSAMENLLTRAMNTSSRIGLMVSKMEDKELTIALKTEQKKQKEQDSLWTGVRAFLTGRSGERDEARTASRQAQIDILSEMQKRMVANNRMVDEYKANGGSASIAVDNVPIAQSTRSESVRTEKVELTIKDETGRSEVKRKNKTSGLQIARSGAI